MSDDRCPEDLPTRDAAALARTAKGSLEDAVVLTVGWSRRHLIDVALTLALTAPDSIGPRLPAETAWTDNELRWAHSAFNGGFRNPRISEGERIYQRLSRRRRRAS